MCEPGGCRETPDARLGIGVPFGETMFEAIKICLHEEIDLERVIAQLVAFGYRACKRVAEVGDFARLGDTLTIYPVTFQYPIRIALSLNRVENISSLDPATYDVLDSHSAAIILPLKGMMRRPPTKREKPVVAGESPIDNFVDIEPGDYVVHVEHGIGLYRGMERARAGSQGVDHFVLEYADGDRLYVPFTDLHKIQKYIGLDRRRPKIHKLGSKLWKRTKERAKRSVAKVAFELLELQAERLSRPGFRFAKDSDWQEELEGSFPYQETPDQTKATFELKVDMESGRPMDRLLCGDVGYGKTEVALRAAFKAVMDNKQVAILVPTTILAEQHLTTFWSRMKRYPVTVEMLSRFRTPLEQKPILEGIANGAVDIVIGTHRLLSPDVKFKDLGLVVIDEEQRFGVQHKERLKRLRLIVDVLTLTATPIPRTLYLALMGGKDISVIDTPPLNRLPVETHVMEYNESVIREAIARELARKGQVYFVNYRIAGIEKIRDRIAMLVPQAKAVVAHGQMPERYLEDAMLKFMTGEIDVLVSTTIIESGIDIPNANTLIVNRADTFGLADLYQLRGRVGRFSRNAYAYFFVPKAFVLPSDAQRRLGAIKKYQDLGSGFKIAMEDLQIRGAGNLLGVEQHGFIHAVGFDLYCRLLKEAISIYQRSLKVPRDHAAGK
jgi:transcription-repair coupling factor (superfamily II helicase)